MSGAEYVIMICIYKSIPARWAKFESLTQRNLSGIFAFSMHLPSPARATVAPLNVIFFLDPQPTTPIGKYSLCNWFTIVRLCHTAINDTLALNTIRMSLHASQEKERSGRT